MNDLKHLLKIHKNIYINMKKKALSYEGEVSNELKNYRRDHHRFSKRPFRRSGIMELINSIKKSRVVYLGDFHTFDQSSRNMQRILHALVRSNKNLALGVEFITKDKLKFVKKFLNNHLSEEEFLDKIDYMANWRFPWNHYKIFFETAKKHNLDIIPLNSKGSLKERDIEAAKIITDFINQNPDTIMFVLFGEYHIVPDKLPLQVKVRAGRKVEQTVIHQNLDQVFWKLQETLMGKQQILKFNNFEYTLQSSPPWVKYESMCYWYESLLDDPEFDIHEQDFFEGEEFDEDDEDDDEEIFDNTLSDTSSETFVDFAGKIAESLGIELPEDHSSDFNLYDHTNMDHVLNNINTIDNTAAGNFYRRLLERSKSFKVPFKNDYYCPSYSVNRIAYLSGIHVLHQHYIKSSPQYEEDLFNRHQIIKFNYFLFRHLIAFFSSKVINPYRKCDYYIDIKNKLYSPGMEERKKIYLNITLEILKDWNKIDEHIKGHSLKVLSSSAKLIGYLLAEYLFEKIMVRDKTRFNALMSIVLDNKNSKESFISLISGVLKGINYKKQRKRVF